MPVCLLGGWSGALARMQLVQKLHLWAERYIITSGCQAGLQLLGPSAAQFCTICSALLGSTSEYSLLASEKVNLPICVTCGKIMLVHTCAWYTDCYFLHRSEIWFSSSLEPKVSLTQWLQPHSITWDPVSQSFRSSSNQLCLHYLPSTSPPPGFSRRKAITLPVAPPTTLAG